MYKKLFLTFPELFTKDHQVQLSETMGIKKFNFKLLFSLRFSDVSHVFDGWRYFIEMFESKATAEPAKHNQPLRDQSECSASDVGWKYDWKVNGNGYDKSTSSDMGKNERYPMMDNPYRTDACTFSAKGIGERYPHRNARKENEFSHYYKDRRSMFYPPSIPESRTSEQYWEESRRFPYNQSRAPQSRSRERYFEESMRRSPFYQSDTPRSSSSGRYFEDSRKFPHYPSRRSQPYSNGRYGDTRDRKRSDYRREQRAKLIRFGACRPQVNLEAKNTSRKCQSMKVTSDRKFTEQPSTSYSDQYRGKPLRSYSDQYRGRPARTSLDQCRGKTPLSYSERYPGVINEGYIDETALTPEEYVYFKSAPLDIVQKATS